MDESISLHTKSKREREQSFGLNDSRTARAMNNLAISLAWKGEYTRSLLLLQESLSIRRRVFGGGCTHVEAGITLNNIGIVLWNLGTFLQAHSVSGYVSY